MVSPHAAKGDRCDGRPGQGLFAIERSLVRCPPMEIYDTSIVLQTGDAKRAGIPTSRPQIYGLYRLGQEPSAERGVFALSGASLRRSGRIRFAKSGRNSEMAGTRPAQATTTRQRIADGRPAERLKDQSPASLSSKSLGLRPARTSGGRTHFNPASVWMLLFQAVSCSRKWGSLTCA